MDVVAREVCVAAGSDQITGPEGVVKITQALSDYFAPDAFGSIYRGVVRFLQFKRAAWSMGDC